MEIHLFDRDQNAEAFAAGATVFNEGATGEVMYALLEGQVEIVINGKVVERIGPGGVFGEMALVEDRPRVATARVTSNARLVSVDRKRFMFLVQQNPFFALQIMAIMAGRLRHMNEGIQSA